MEKRRMEIQPIVGEKIVSDIERLSGFSSVIEDIINAAVLAIRKERKADLEAGKKSSRTDVPEIAKKSDQASLDALNELRRNIDDKIAGKPHLAEMNALIESARMMFVQRQAVKYKEYQFLDGAPQLTEDEKTRQDMMREDMTEGRALIQWHVVQNSDNPRYVRDFMNTMTKMLANVSPDKDNSWIGLERGIRQELGMYQTLKSIFEKVEPATPAEDAHYSIDFWVEDESGKKLIIQSKSTGPFGGDGVFDRSDIEALIEREENKPYSVTKYELDDNGEPITSRLARARKMKSDIDRALEYAKTKGINARYLFVICNEGNFRIPAGEPKWELMKPFCNQLENVNRGER